MYLFLFYEIRLNARRGLQQAPLRLAGTDEQTIFKMAHELLTNHEEHKKMAKASNPYGDGNASARIAEAVRYYFKQVSVPPTRFEP